MILSIIGPPGSGKSTQAKALGKRLGIPVLSLGSELREEKGKRSERSKKIEKYLKQGDPVPADIIKREILEWIKEDGSGKGFITDSFPRRKFDAKFFQEEILPNLPIKNLPQLGVVELNIPLSESLKRIGSRHKAQARQRRTGRKDEAEKTTRHRYKWYKEHRAKLKKYYEDLNKWHTIDGDRDVAEIQEELEKWVKEKEKFMHNQIVVILGAAGSGKDTQAEKLEKYGYKVFSTGDAFRAAIKKKTKMGNLIHNKYMKAGLHVPDKYVRKVVFNNLKQMLGRGQKIAATGIVRKVSQAKFIDKDLAKLGHIIKKTVLLDVPKQMLVDRLALRRVCPKCKRNYHLKFKSLKPKKDELCDDCGVKLIQREDEFPEAINARLQTQFYDVIEPIKKYYKKTGRLYMVDGRPAPEKVAEYVAKVVKK